MEKKKNGKTVRSAEFWHGLHSKWESLVLATSFIATVDSRSAL